MAKVKESISPLKHKILCYKQQITNGGLFYLQKNLSIYFSWSFDFWTKFPNCGRSRLQAPKKSRQEPPTLQKSNHHGWRETIYPMFDWVPEQIRLPEDSLTLSARLESQQYAPLPWSRLSKTFFGSKWLSFHHFSWRPYHKNSTKR